MIKLTGNDLTIHDVHRTARENARVSISDAGKKRVHDSYQRVLKIVDEELPVYGINTGFGIFADQTISKAESKKLNRNLIISHAVGTGDPLPAEIVRAAMLIRANALTKGYSGIHPELVESLIALLNSGVIPYINSKGSLGSSGDLCMLAQMALVFTKGEKELVEDSGRAYLNGKLVSGLEAMQKADIERKELEHKDGLALINGATFSAAILALCTHDAELICDLADISVSLSLEALKGKTDAFVSELHESRGLGGQKCSARNIRKMIEGSSLIDSDDRVQDAYSLRCAPQVHGAVRDSVVYVASIIEREINVATDNPLILEDGRAVSGGNFHGEPIGLCADFLAVGLTELGAISERRIFRMLDKNLNAGLPPMLVDNDRAAGLNSGIMMLQYTAAALALENQTLAVPDSIHSLPTSANQEDHNANSCLAALHAREVLHNTLKILAIEIFSACRAIDLRLNQLPNARIGKRTEQILKKIRAYIPYIGGDALWGIQMEKLFDLLMNQTKFPEEIQSILH